MTPPRSPSPISRGYPGKNKEPTDRTRHDNILIHLLNRQRYRVVEWAAMDFLREAMRRSRRILRLRDLLLMALRTLCVLLFALAMARPCFIAASADVDPDQPVHAVLVVDNSLSMGYEQLEGTVLDEAKARAKTFLDRLPPGSRICDGGGYRGRFGEVSRDDYYSMCEEILGVPSTHCVNTLGMGESATNCFDDTLRNHTLGRPQTERNKPVPPWTRVQTVSLEDLSPLPPGYRHGPAPLGYGSRRGFPR